MHGNPRIVVDHVASAPDDQLGERKIATERFQRHRLLRPGPADAADVVGWFGAVQAQDYRAARWALALRMRGSIMPADIDAALAGGEILRTHVMRPTWHFVARGDIRWLLELTAPRVHQALAFGRKSYELSDALQRRAAKVIERSLGREPCLTRSELAVRLARAGIAVKGVRLAFVTIYAELERLICSGPHRGDQPTYALLDSRAPQSAKLERDEALGELTTRYLRSHGPATARDFSWWSGLTMADAKRGLAIVRARRQTVDGLTYWTLPGRARIPAPSNVVHLLPVFDEYLVAYRDSRPVPRGTTAGGFLPQAVVCGGRVVGTWKVTKDREGRGRGTHPRTNATLVSRPGSRAGHRTLSDIRRDWHEALIDSVAQTPRALTCRMNRLVCLRKLRSDAGVDHEFTMLWDCAGTMNDLKQVVGRPTMSTHFKSAATVLRRSSAPLWR